MQISRLITYGLVTMVALTVFLSVPGEKGLVKAYHLKQELTTLNAENTVLRQENEVLAVPVWLGQQTANVRQILSSPEGKGHRLEWAYPGLLSLQCLAFYQQSGPGLYVACDDTAAFGKAFAFFGGRVVAVEGAIVGAAGRYWPIKLPTGLLEIVGRRGQRVWPFIEIDTPILIPVLAVM